MPGCGDQGEKQNTARCANESASWGRQIQATQGLRGGCRAPCQRARPLRRAGSANAHRMGLRKCSCQESEASLGSSRRLSQSLTPGRWRIPHLLISLSALGRTVCPPVHLLRTASQPQAIRFLHAHQIAHVSHAACVFLFLSALHILCVQKHSPIPAVRVDD